jgi:ATP-dependent DNA helicase RecG
LASEPRRKGKIDRDLMSEVVLNICRDRFVTLSCLAELVNRRPETLREQYLKRMVQSKSLSMAFPKTPTHEKQAYTTTSE